MKRFKDTKEASRRRRLRRVEWGGFRSGFSRISASLKDVGWAGGVYLGRGRHGHCAEVVVVLRISLAFPESHLPSKTIYTP